MSARVRLPVVTPALVIAIDGPAGSGKSSVSREVASRLGLAYLDTGAMYRAATWVVLDRGIDPEDTDAVAALMTGDAAPAIESGTDPAEPFICVDGVDVAEAIRGELVTSAVSAVSAVGAVRQGMVDLQREHAHASSGIVVEGRDIGSVVLPQADVKVFLTADPGVRAQRRAAEVNVKDAGSVSATEDALRARDAKDTTRAISPLAPAEGSIEIDTTNLTFDDVVDAVISLVRDAPEGR
ncbi:MAG: (d)CMP kinase [Actinomycetota bacterium]|nr:(d)CMP kinase [Actinomycetota bacterium]